jgi:hypothetical protein
VIKTVAGPFTREAAEDTAKALGNQFSAYGVTVEDAEGYYDEAASDNNWFVEKDGSIIASRIFGMAWEQIQALQQGKA